MKEYKINTPDESYIETLLVNGVMINVFLSDSGQCYFLQYYEPETNELVTTGCGTYESDYKGVAEMLFEDPKNCEFYSENEESTLENHMEGSHDLNRCDREAKTYCSNCKFCGMVQDREKRMKKKELRNGK